MIVISFLFYEFLKLLRLNLLNKFMEKFLLFFIWKLKIFNLIFLFLYNLIHCLFVHFFLIKRLEFLFSREKHVKAFNYYILRFLFFFFFLFIRRKLVGDKLFLILYNFFCFFWVILQIFLYIFVIFLFI